MTLRFYTWAEHEDDLTRDHFDGADVIDLAASASVKLDGWFGVAELTLESDGTVFASPSEMTLLLRTRRGSLDNDLEDIVNVEWPDDRDLERAAHDYLYR